ncbi:putative reverse transcriptase domain-containing protein [Tanacetum coccineum]
MVNTRTDAELAAAVQAAVDAMLPQIREQVREEYRTGAVASGSNPPPVTIHTWLERFNKQKPRSFEKAVAPVDAENWISHMEKIFDVMDCNDAFKTRLAVYKFEGDALAWWKAYKQAKGGDAWVLTLTWAAFKELFFLQFFPRAEQERLKREYHSIRQRASKNSTEYMQRFLRLAGFLGQAAGLQKSRRRTFVGVADAARNLEILRDRDDYDRSERSDKRHKSGDRYHPYSQQGSHRSHGQSDDRQKNDRQGSDRQGGGGNYRNNNNNNYSRDNNRNSGTGRDQRNRGSQQSRVPSEGYTHPVCNTCGRRHPGECRRAAGTCFKCGQAGHLQRDCKKNFGASSSGHADKKPDASGRVFALTQDQAANTSGTITGALFIFGRAVFVLFDTGATHSVISTKFASCFTMTPILLDHVLCISTPMKDSARITHVYRDLPLQFDDKIRSVNALPLDMCEFDIILGIDWLAAHRATIDCHSHRVIFGDIHAPEFIYHEIPAIVYKDALTSEPEVSSEPMVSPHHVKKVAFDFTISFAKSDDEDYTFIYDKNSSSYKIIYVNNFKPDTSNDNDEINVELPSKDISIKPLDSVINVNVDTYSYAFDKNIETNHDTFVLTKEAHKLYITDCHVGNRVLTLVNPKAYNAYPMIEQNGRAGSSKESSTNSKGRISLRRLY